jgi:hypothetical protein
VLQSGGQQRCKNALFAVERDVRSFGNLESAVEEDAAPLLQFGIGVSTLDFGECEVSGPFLTTSDRSCLSRLYFQNATECIQISVDGSQMQEASALVTLSAILRALGMLRGRWRCLQSLVLFTHLQKQHSEHQLEILLRPISRREWLCIQVVHRQITVTVALPRRRTALEQEGDNLRKT